MIVLLFRTMALSLEEQLRQSNDRFVASISSILERYNQPFEDDFLISMETLTYYTPNGPEQWEKVSTKKLKKWKKEIFEFYGEIQRNAEMSKQETSDFEDGYSTVHRESPESSHVDTSDIGEENHTDVDILKRESVDVYSQNLYVEDGKIPKQVKVDVIVQDYARKIPKWITIAPQGSLEGLPLASAMQDLSDTSSQTAVCRKKVDLSHQCSSLSSLQLEFSGVPTSPNTISIHRPRPSSELNKTCCIVTLEEYHSGDEECSWSNMTVADLYPAMVEILKRCMTKHSVRKELKYLFGHLRRKRCCSRRPKLSVTVNKIRGFRPYKLKQALPSICSSRSQDVKNQTFGNDNIEFHGNKRSVNDLSALVPYSYSHINEIKPSYSDSSLEHHLVSGKGQKLSKQTVLPNVMASMGETFLVEDELQATVSLKNSKCEESEKFACKCSSEYHFMTSTASSGSKVFHLVKESKTPKIDFSCGVTSELCSSPCSLYGNSNVFTPVTNNSLAKASDTLLINPGKVISERLTSFQHKNSFSSLTVKQSPSEMFQKCEDAFEKLYYKLCSKEIPKPLTLTRLHSNSQNPEEKGGLVKNNLSASVMSKPLYDSAFDRIYEQLRSEAVPKLPGFQRASNLRKYEGISQTVNALVNSPVRTSSSSLGVKRLGNFPHDLCSPVKRLKNIPERYLPSTQCQQIAPRISIHFQAVGTDFLSTYKGSNPSSFDSHNCQSQNSGFYASSDKTSLAIPGTSLQVPEIAEAHSIWCKRHEGLRAVLEMSRSVTKEYPEN